MIWIALLEGHQLSDAEVWGSISARRDTGKTITSLRRDLHPAMKGLQPPEHHREINPDQKYSSE